MLDDDATLDEDLVALTPYLGSRENAETLASQFHAVVQFHGLEALLKVILSDSPGVAIAAVNLYNARERPPVCRARAVPDPPHQPCLPGYGGLATDKALTRSSRTWRWAHELVKAVRSGHVHAALGELGSEVTTIDIPNEIRWHHRPGYLEKLIKIKPHLIQLLLRAAGEPRCDEPGLCDGAARSRDRRL